MANRIDASVLSSSFTSTSTSRGSGPFADFINTAVAMLITDAVAKPANAELKLSACIELTVQLGEDIGTCRLYDDKSLVDEWHAVLRAYLPRDKRANTSVADAINYCIDNKVPVRFFVKRGGFASKPNYPSRVR